MRSEKQRGTNAARRDRGRLYIKRRGRRLGSVWGRVLSTWPRVGLYEEKTVWTPYVYDVG